MNFRAMFEGFYAGKRVLVTGHTGFKGGWLSLWLKELGADVLGLALPPEPSPNLYEVIRPGTFSREFFIDVRDDAALEQAVCDAEPNFIVHLAAQPLVRRSYSEPVATVQTNVMGTVHLLEAVRRLGRPVPVLVVTSDKCYEDHGRPGGCQEADALGGHDIYSASKAACELLTTAWRRSFFERDPSLGQIATARAGNVIGGGDYAADRIVPDCIRALGQGHPIRVRHPLATRPWQHILDCLSGYLWLGARLAAASKPSPFANAFNFGPGARVDEPVRTLVKEILKHWPGEWVDASEANAPPESAHLSLAIDKASRTLGWAPTWGFAPTVRHTVEWYRRRHERGNTGLREFSVGQISTFTRDAAAEGRAWAATESAS